MFAWLLLMSRRVGIVHNHHLVFFVPCCYCHNCKYFGVVRSMCFGCRCKEGAAEDWGHAASPTSLPASWQSGNRCQQRAGSVCRPPARSRDCGKEDALQLFTTRAMEAMGGRYTSHKVLGIGGFGVVLRAEHFDGSVRAVKFQLLSNAPSEAEMLAVRQEAQFLSTLLHPHIISLFYSGEHRVESTGQTFFVLDMELASHDMNSEMRVCSRNGTHITPLRVAQVVFQMLSALRFLHQHELVHRDIKPPNILVVGPICKLADLGLLDHCSVVLREKVAGTEGYLPPEVYRKLPMAKAWAPTIDIWALGVTAYELTFFELPFKDFQQPAPIPLEFPAEMRAQQPSIVAFMNAALQVPPHLRPLASSAQELLADFVHTRIEQKTTDEDREAERSVAWLRKRGEYVDPELVTKANRSRKKRRQANRELKLAMKSKAHSEAEAAAGASSSTPPKRPPPPPPARQRCTGELQKKVF